MKMASLRKNGVIWLLDLSNIHIVFVISLYSSGAAAEVTNTMLILDKSKSEITPNFDKTGHLKINLQGNGLLEQ